MRGSLATDGELWIDELSSEVPLEVRVADALAAEVDAESSLLASARLALAGRRREAEAALARARAIRPSDPSGFELGNAFVMLELGSPARAAGALERAEALDDFSGHPTRRAFSEALHAQLLLQQEAWSAARAAAQACVERLGEGPLPALGAYALLAAAESALDRAPKAALAQLEQASGADGLLAVRRALLEARVRRRLGESGRALRAQVEDAIARLERLGAPRDRGLAYLALAEVTSGEGGEPPAKWVAAAQPLLSEAGTSRELQRLREAFRTHGRRKVDGLITTGTAGTIDAVRERRARLRDQLEALRDARDAQAGSGVARRPLDSAIDNLLDALESSEDGLIDLLEQTIVDREQVSQLVAVSQQIASLESAEELVAEVPRLGLLLFPGEAAALYALSADGPTRVSPGKGQVEVAPDRLLREGQAALQTGAAALLADEGAQPHRPADDRARRAPGKTALVPLRTADGLVLVLQRRSAGLLADRELEQLTVFGSLAGAAIARARSSAALREAAARDAATLSAIRDGVLSLDEEGRVRALNEAAARLLGVSPRAVLQRRLAELPGLDSLAAAIFERNAAGEAVAVPTGGVLVRAQRYEGGAVATLQELATAQKLAQRLVGPGARFTFESLLGKDPVLLACVEDARRAARSDVPLLITGESGTGKELLAQAIHNASAQASAPFVGVNVAAIPRELLESELFGYEAGAFTGARAGGNSGKFELAENGTLLLDEIGDMPLEMQAKLLRVLQERVLQRLGGSRHVVVRARLIATTHHDLERAVQEGGFRLDLFHRLRGVHLRLPPLRERRGDIALLAQHQLDQFCARLGRRPIRLSARVLEALQAYDWPGNVRELANVVEGAATLLEPGAEVIDRVPPSIERSARAQPVSAASPLPASEAPVLPFEEVERQIFEHALRQFGGNVAKAALALGVSRGTLYNKMKRFQFKI